MIGHEDENEEVHYKVADRRKFNADGSLREGVTLERAEDESSPQATANIDEQGSKSAETVNESKPATKRGTDTVLSDTMADSDFDEVDAEEIPGATDPASFVNFLSMLATNAATALGAIPNPATGQRSLDLETGKYWLDLLGMLKEKTSGNLHPQETKVIDGLLGDLRMQYVHLVKASEENRKAQAAPKISGSDILGNK